MDPEGEKQEWKIKERANLPDAPMETGNSLEQMVDPTQATQETTEPEAKDTEPTAENQTTGETITIDGAAIPIEQAKEWLSKGKDATKKWQEAAELKKEAEAQYKEVEQISELVRYWNQAPELDLSAGPPSSGTQPEEEP